MSGAPLVSVIMPAYNRERTIQSAVESALAQTMGNLELIIADDCSTDSTPDIIAELACADPRIRVVRNRERCGAARTRNNAIDAASGEFFAFLDSDDLWEHGKLERQLEHIRKTGCDLCYSSYDYFDRDGMSIYRPYMVPEATTHRELLKENIIGHSTVVLRKIALGSLRYDKDFFHEDYVLWLKLLRKGIVARGVSEVLVHNQIGGRSDNKWEAMKNRWHIYRKAENLSFVQSCWYLAFYASAGRRKYGKK